MSGFPVQDGGEMDDEHDLLIVLKPGKPESKKGCTGDLTHLDVGKFASDSIVDAP